MVVCLSAPALAGAGEELKMKFDAAEAAYDVGDFEKAKRLYSEAYELKQLPGFLFNIGQCHKKLGEWNKAAFFYRRYLARVGEGSETTRLEELILQMDARAAAPPPAPLLAPVVVRPRPAPKLIPAVAVTPQPVEAVSAPAPAVSEGGEPLYRQWWLWAGAGVATTATVVAIVAASVASSGPPPGKFGKLDAR